MSAIRLDTIGRIVKGEDLGTFLRVLDDSEDTGGFFVLHSNTVSFMDVHDVWLEDWGALEEYFEAMGWSIDWQVEDERA